MLKTILGAIGYMGLGALVAIGLLCLMVWGTVYADEVSQDEIEQAIVNTQYHDDFDQKRAEACKKINEVLLANAEAAKKAIAKNPELKKIYEPLLRAVEEDWCETDDD